ncbi:efflux RND transporter periplasmic adaptor subunit [Roseimaritima ulvae]|uniref:Multidrug resistance protein MdtA n=1 Tax=Roseimaritima ulvae TaxID=980254 RepID=A0A5B9QQD1_9BACT|nr:efflux RND transporter periplasmic adaptor subunit [Roseimaritima ulvae]QEG40122.1 Multidrug resistance protein MdtA precursor [Roseimaritima ulvae]
MTSQPTRPQKPSRRRWLQKAFGSLLVIGGVLGLLAGIAYAKSRQIQAAMAAPPPPEMPVAVTLTTAQPTTFRQTSVVIGNLLAPQSITLRTELAGVVTRVHMTPGGSVEKDAVLVELDTRSEQALLKSAEASRKLADSTLQRSQRLKLANANSASELDIAEAELTRAEAQIEELRVRIDKKTLRAPFAAHVGLFDLHVGQYLVEGTEITTLEGIADYLKIDFAMPSHVADAVSIGDQVALHVGAAGIRLSATIVAVDAAANALSRSVTARARLDNPPDILQPNDSVRVTVPYGPPIAARLIPATAIRRGPSGTLAFVVVEIEGQLRAQSRDVVVAGSDGPNARVLSGVEAGEVVVADGSFKVFDGALVADAAAALDSTEPAAPTAVVEPAANAGAAQ